jgi:capsular polysaccharide biosynthesis protein
LDEYREISLKELFVCLWEKIWVIILSTLIFGVVSYFITLYLITPEYESYVTLYVNNKTESTGSLTSSDVSAAKSLVDTYITIIESNSVVDEVVLQAGFTSTAEQIRKMISAKSINNTEVFQVSITGPSAQNNAIIANLIADIAPAKISEIVEGSSVKIIDRAQVPVLPISPNMTKNVIIAAFLGFILSSMIIVLIHMFDTTIRNENDIKAFCNLPVLGIFSDFNQVSGSNKYSYYAERGTKNE